MKGATIPLRTCEGCEEERICRDIPDKGRYCAMCQLTMECCDATTIDDADPMLKTLVVKVSEGEMPTIEELFLLNGSVVGGTLRYLIDHPHRIRTLAAEAEDRAKTPRRIH